MSLTTPILNEVGAWDVANGNTFTFTAIGGNQITGNTLTIRNNTTNAVVYTNTVTSFLYSNTVPANASGLTNGTYYNAYITTTDSAGETSSDSNVIQFYCYTTPTLTFTNVTEGGVVDNSSLNATVTYDQAQGEPINSYNIMLYDASRNLITSSGAQYSSVTTTPVSFSQLFTGLIDSTAYYVRATGYTSGGTTIETGYVGFTVRYEASDVYTAFSVVNNCVGGYISTGSRAALISGTSSPSSPTFVDDKYIDLTVDGSYVEYDDGLEIAGDFTAKIWFYNPKINADLLTLTDGDGDTIVVRLMEDYSMNGHYFATLDITNGYSIYSPSSSPTTSTQQYCIQVRRVGNVYDIVLGVVTK